MSRLDNPHGGLSSIVEYNNTDPSVAAGIMWVRRDFVTVGVAGVPMGLLLSLTYTGDGPSTYQLSYQTTEGPIIRTTLN